MRKRNKSALLCFLCLITYILSSCNSGIDLSNMDDTSIKFDESLVFPVAEANLSVKDILNNISVPSAIGTDSSEIFFKWDFNDQVVLDTLNMVDSIKPLIKIIYPADSIPVGTILPPNVSIPITVPYMINLGLNSDVTKQRIDSAFINSSLISVDFTVSNDITIPADDFKIEFIFDEKYVKLENPSSPYVPTHYGQPLGVINLGKYVMYINGKNQIPYRIKVTVTPNIPLPITAATQLNLTLKFKKVDLKVAYGYFNYDETIKKTIVLPFKVEDYLPDAYLKFADPQLNISTKLNVGTDFNVKFDSVSVFNNATPSDKVWAWFANHTTNETTEHIAGPTVFGNWSTATFTQFNAKHGEMDHMFDNKPYPNMLGYNIHIKSDPSRIVNYASPDGKVTVDMGLKIPLKLKGGSNYAFNDTINNLDFGTVLDNVDSALLILKIKNGLPVKAHYRMTFWTSATDTIPAVGGSITKITNDSTFGNMTSEFTLHSAQVDSAGNVTQMVPQTLKIKLNKEQIIALKPTQSIVFHVYLDSEKTLVNGVPTLNPIHLTPTNTFGVKLGVFAKGSYTTNIGSSK